MKTSYKRIRLSLNSFVQSVVCHHVNVSEFVLIVYGNLAPIRNQININWLAGCVVLVRSLECEHHVSNWAIGISSQKVQLFVKTFIKTFEVVKWVLFPDKFAKEKVCKLWLHCDSLVNCLPKETPKKSENFNIFSLTEKTVGFCVRIKLFCRCQNKKTIIWIEHNLNELG